MLAKLQSVLENKDFRVFCVPEAATLMKTGGAILDTSKMSWDFQVQMQTSLLKTQISLEDIFYNIAQSESAELNKPAVVLCDRGIFDGSAYVSSELWTQILDEQGLDGGGVIDKRYDAVVHMITAADGAEKFYDFSNEARYENIEEARARDLRLREAYLGHHRYFVIGNQGNHFGEKIDKTIGIIKSVLGLPTSKGTFKKYLVDGKDFMDDHSNLLFPEKQQV